MVINTELAPVPAKPGDGGSGRGRCLHAGHRGSGGTGDDQATWQVATRWFAGHWAPLVLALAPWQGFSLCPPAVDQAVSSPRAGFDPSAWSAGVPSP